MVTYRIAEARDSGSIRELLSVPDTGAYSVSRVFHHDPLPMLAAINERPGAVVAQSEGRIVGVLMIERHPILWNGEIRKGVFVGNLTIAPAFRRQGVAAQLQPESLRLYAEDVDGAIVHAMLQPSNEASVGMIAPHLRHRTRVLPFARLGTRRLPPFASRRQGFELREATRADLGDIAEHMNRYFREHQLYQPVTAASLLELSERSFAGHRPYQLYLVERGARLVAGGLLIDRTPLEQYRVHGLGLRRRLAARVANVMELDGRARTQSLRALWFEPQQDAAAAHLIDTLAYRRSGALSCCVDERDPAFSIVSERRRGGGTVCWFANEPGDDERPIFVSG